MSKTKELPQFLRDLIASPPRHGEGVHQWLFKIARQLHAHRDEGDIFHLLAAAVDGCGRDVPESEITEAVEAARGCAWKQNGRTVTTKTAPKWPERDEQAIATIAAADPDALAALRNSSPVEISTNLHDADCLLERLFPCNPLICAAASVKESIVMPRQRLSAGNYPLIVPSPMNSTEGINQKGNKSTRCLDNTGERFYLIAECDQGDRDTQAAVIRHLARIAPLVMVVDSGGKSLHAWFHCRGLSEDKLRTFFRMAVALGADPATWTRCQLVRMPLATRDNGKLQAVHFFDHANAEHNKGRIRP